VFATQGEGDKCLKRLIQAEQKWKFNDKKDRAEIEMYGGICGYLVGETQASEVSFKNAIKIDPKLELPKDLGPGIEGLWAKATGKTTALAASNPPPKKDEPPAGKKQPDKVAEAPSAEHETAPPRRDTPPAEKKLTPDEKLDQQLSDEASAPPTTEAKGRSFVAPVVLGILGVGAGVTAAVLGLQAKSHEALFKSPDTFYSDAQSIGSQAKTEALVTNIMFAAGGALLIAAVIAFVVSG
jgi:hypothetical protein